VNYYYEFFITHQQNNLSSAKKESLLEIPGKEADPEIKMQK